MKRFLSIISFVIFLFIAVSPVSADWALQWTPPVIDETHGAPTGYTIYFTDGTNMWNISVPATEGATAEMLDVFLLNIPYNTELTYTVVAYNNGGPGEPSEPVTWTRPAFEPPADILPDPPDMKPGKILQWILNWLDN